MPHFSAERQEQPVKLPVGGVCASQLRTAKLKQQHPAQDTALQFVSNKRLGIREITRVCCHLQRLPGRHVPELHGAGLSRDRRERAVR